MVADEMGRWDHLGLCLADMAPGTSVCCTTLDGLDGMVKRLDGKDAACLRLPSTRAAARTA